jgi:tRNA-uridine 2-sulfurtransferase
LKTKNPKALVLLSGGLDSTLAVRVLQNAGCEVTALSFETPFFNANKARKAAQNLGIEIITKDISEIHFPIVQNPPHGYGKNMNPCVDCHGLMFRLAGELMDGSPLSRGRHFDIVVSGEVLGQRPFSQNPTALRTVQKIAGIEILRPLCAKNLPETSYEKSGLVDRGKLFDFQSKNRKPQMALAKKFGITDYPTPAGGCLLTDPGYSRRLREFLERDPDATPEDVRLIRIGRFSPIGERSFAMIGRGEAENEQLEVLESSKIYLIKMQDFVGPTALLRIKKPDDFEKIFPELAQKIRSYGRDSKKHEGEIVFIIWGKENTERKI